MCTYICVSASINVGSSTSIPVSICISVFLNCGHTQNNVDINVSSSISSSSNTAICIKQRHNTCSYLCESRKQDCVSLISNIFKLVLILF